jgi:hypothetical protein
MNFIGKMKIFLTAIVIFMSLLYFIDSAEFTVKEILNHNILILNYDFLPKINTTSKNGETFKAVVMERDDDVFLKHFNNTKRKH